MAGEFLQSRSIILGIITIFIVFTLSLTETIQLSDGFSSKSTAGWVYNLNPGESEVLTWTLTNSEEVPINIEFRAEGEGSELFVFEKLVIMEPKEQRSFEFIVIVPDDHPNNVEYRPILFALERALPSDGGAAAVLINYQMSAKPIIKIGDDPIYTAPVIEKEKIEEKPLKEETPTKEDFSTAPTETIEEKLARIAEANKDVKDDDSFDESLKEEPMSNYEPESMPDPEPITHTIIREDDAVEEGGGCLIATAAYGTELAPQIQFLREIRDNTVMSTVSGISFMTGFNQLYYSFSPTIADMERKNPMFQEAVRAFITPMISTLSIMTLAEKGNDAQVLGLGIFVIVLNSGLYIAAPTVAGYVLSKRLRN